MTQGEGDTLVKISFTDPPLLLKDTTSGPHTAPMGYIFQICS